VGGDEAAETAETSQLDDLPAARSSSSQIRGQMLGTGRSADASALTPEGDQAGCVVGPKQRRQPTRALERDPDERAGKSGSSLLSSTSSRVPRERRARVRAPTTRQLSAATACARCSAASTSDVDLIEHRGARCVRNPAVNQSPAPPLSVTVVGRAGSLFHRPLPMRYRRPLAPSVSIWSCPGRAESTA